MGVSSINTAVVLSLLFVGSLRFDGQKAIWVHQMEGLPRERFAPVFMTLRSTCDGSEEDVQRKEREEHEDPGEREEREEREEF